MKCIGCDSEISWNGMDLFCLTCQCGARIFYKDGDRIYFPASLVIALQNHTAYSGHLDDLIGESNFTSFIKTRITEFLMSKGIIWMKDCERCNQDGTYQRKLERDKHFALLEAESILRQAKL